MKLSSLICNVAVALAWDASESTDQSGDVHLFTSVRWTDANGQNPGIQDAGTDTTATVSLPPGKWKVTVVAYNQYGVSDPSNEVDLAVANVEIQKSTDGMQTWQTTGASSDELVVGNAIFKPVISVP